MADWFTCIVIFLLVIALLITNIYVLAYFCHPDDKGSCIGWVMKIIVIIGLTLAWIQVLLLPIDVSNHRTFGGGLDMKLFWYIIYILTIIYILVISPIASSYYEADYTWSCKEKICHSLCWFFIYFIFFLLITIILYASIGKADVPIKTISCNYLENYQSYDSPFEKPKQYETLDGEIEIKVNFLIYAIAVLLFVSWLLFAFFGGIGLAALPIDLFCSFRKRPKKMRSKEIETRKKNLIKNIEELKSLGQELKHLESKGSNKQCKCSRERRNYDRQYSQFRAGYMLADEEFKIVNAENEERKKGNCVVLLYYLLIPLGILAMICTLLWIIQFCCSYFLRKNGRPGYPFLARMYIFFNDHDLAFLSFFIFSILSLYLLLCVIKGNFKFGVRILCCWEIFPMKKDGTYMNSFLFNVTLILLASCSITQFCADCLEDYVVFTDINMIFNVQIRYLRFFRIFYKYHVFQYILFVVFIISLIYLLIRPSDSLKKVLNKKTDRNHKLENDSNKNNNSSSGLNNSVPALGL